MSVPAMHASPKRGNPYHLQCRHMWLHQTHEYIHWYLWNRLWCSRCCLCCQAVYHSMAGMLQHCQTTSICEFQRRTGYHHHNADIISVICAFGHVGSQDSAPMHELLRGCW